MLNPRLALVLGAGLLLAVPTLGFDHGASGARSTSASVVTGADAYAAGTAASPTLGLGNGYTADFVTVTNRYATGTTFDVTVTLTSGPARFTLVAPTSTTGLGVGSSFVVKITDTAFPHTPTSNPVTVRVDVTVKNGASNVGFASYSLTGTVTV